MFKCRYCVYCILYIVYCNVVIGAKNPADRFRETGPRNSSRFPSYLFASCYIRGKNEARLTFPILPISFLHIFNQKRSFLLISNQKRQISAKADPAGFPRRNICPFLAVPYGGGQFWTDLAKTYLAAGAYPPPELDEGLVNFDGFPLSHKGSTYLDEGAIGESNMATRDSVGDQIFRRANYW